MCFLKHVWRYVIHDLQLHWYSQIILSGQNLFHVLLKFLNCGRKYVGAFCKQKPECHIIKWNAVKPPYFYNHIMTAAGHLVFLTQSRSHELQFNHKIRLIPLRICFKKSLTHVHFSCLNTRHGSDSLQETYDGSFHVSLSMLTARPKGVEIHSWLWRDLY